MPGAEGYGASLTLLPWPACMRSLSTRAVRAYGAEPSDWRVRRSPQGTGMVQLELDMECTDGQTVRRRATGKVPGIAPDMQAHPFEKYRTGLNGPHGAGWGLYLAMGPARRRGDGPCAQNLPGAGAAVILSPPIQPAHSAVLFSEAGPCREREPAWRAAAEFNALSAAQTGARPWPGTKAFAFSKAGAPWAAARGARLLLWKKTAVCALLYRENHV